MRESDAGCLRLEWGTAHYLLEEAHTRLPDGVSDRRTEKRDIGDRDRLLYYWECYVRARDRSTTTINLSI